MPTRNAPGTVPGVSPWVRALLAGLLALLLLALALYAVDRAGGHVTTSDAYAAAAVAILAAAVAA